MNNNVCIFCETDKDVRDVKGKGVCLECIDQLEELTRENIDEKK